MSILCKPFKDYAHPHSPLPLSPTSLPSPSPLTHSIPHLTIQRQLKLGESVGHRLTSEALCFGGHTCTLTDVAVAAGVAPHNICQVPGALDSLNPTLVYKAMCHIREMIENGIDCLKVCICMTTTCTCMSLCMHSAFP